MDQIQTTVMVAAGSLAVIAVVMLAVCFKFTTVANRLLEKLQEQPLPAAPPLAQAPAPVTPPPALNGVDEETAAMLMAITADKLKNAPEELRFISIKECR